MALSLRCKDCLLNCSYPHLLVIMLIPTTGTGPLLTMLYFYLKNSHSGNIPLIVIGGFPVGGNRPLHILRLYWKKGTTFHTVSSQFIVNVILLNIAAFPIIHGLLLSCALIRASHRRRYLLIDLL